MTHNLIDHTVMSRILGMKVLPREFRLEEDTSRPLAEGVTWRRRRFLFLVETDQPETPDRPEGLCINEIIIDSDSKAALRPRLAAQYPHLVELPEIENAYWATTFAQGALRASSSAKVKESRLYLNMGALYFGDDAEQRAELLASIRALHKGAEPSEGLLNTLDPLEPQYVPQPAGGFGVARYLPAFPASRLVQSALSIVAASNAGYFLNFPEEYGDGFSALHQPVGGHQVEGKLLAPPWLVRPGYIGFPGGKIRADLFGPEDLELTIGTLAPLPLHRAIRNGDPQGQVWRFFDGTDRNLPAGAAAILYTGNLLVDIVPATADTQPPLGGAMVIVTGAHAAAALQPGAIDSIKLQLRHFPEGTPEWMVSSGPFLVRGSAPVAPTEMLSEAHAGEFRAGGPAPTRFPFDVSNTRAPRTSLGTTPSGGLKIVVVDGRRSGEHSCGVTLEGLSHLMAWVGCETAINLDGGGSSVLAIEGALPEDKLRENLPHGVVNIPSDDGGRERIVPIFLSVEIPD